MESKAGIVAEWHFDEHEGSGAVDNISGGISPISGHCKRVPGVAGKAVQFDEFDTDMVCPAGQAPKLAGDFSVEAWIAPRTYPWNWCPIVMQANEQKGFFFGVDADSRFGLHVCVDGQWQRCNTKAALPGLGEQSLVQFIQPKPVDRAKPILPLLKWSHLLGTFSERDGITLYLDGRPAGHLATSGRFTAAPDLDLHVGRNPIKTLPAHMERPTANTPFNFSFDGLIDEVKIYNHALSAEEAQTAFAAVRPQVEQPLTFRRIPTGPKGPARFGAYTTRLSYDEDWDIRRRMGDYADIVVMFDEFPFKLIYWNGLNYYPTWWTENDIGIAHEGPETWKDSTGYCYEAMMDRQCRYSQVKIIENTDARVKILWRFAPADMMYQLVNIDPQSHWPDWAEDVYTIYPDGVAARQVTLWTSYLPGNHSFEQEDYIIQPGLFPDDIIEKEAITLANMDGREFPFTWQNSVPTAAGPKILPEKPGRSTVNDTRVYFGSVPGLRDPVIQWYNLKAQSKPFMIVQPVACRFGLLCPDNQWPWSLYWWDHWPIADVPSDGLQQMMISGRPSSSCVTQTAYEKKDPHNILTDRSLTMFFLFGMTLDKTAGQLAPLARSWNQPPALELSGPGFSSEGYSVPERAYVLHGNTSNRLDGIAFSLRASEASPVVNPAFVIKNWGEAAAVLTLDGKEVPRGKDFRFGHRQTLESTDLIIWIKAEAQAPLNFRIEPQRKP